jgi:methionyl-tRNA formyltransferase
MGSPEFAVPTLEALAAHYSVAGVVTQPDRPAGRGGKMQPPAVKAAATRLGLSVMQPERIRMPDSILQLKAWSPDLIVVTAYGQILPQVVLDLAPHGCINVHGSLLPRWRGAAPIQASILQGDPETGITIMKMDTGVDTGPILSQRVIKISPMDTADSLFSKMAPIGAELLMETLSLYLGGELSPHAQPEKGVTYSPTLKKGDGLLDFNKPAVELERRVRAMNPWPGAFFSWNGTPLKVNLARVGLGKSPGVGCRFAVDGSPAVGTGEGILILEDVQPAGKKIMPGKAFISGARDWINI